jgi:hypothetical protein
MDLISRKAAIQSIDEKIEAICEGNDLTAYQEETASMCREWFVDEIAKVPSVPAVPLDKLCELFKETNARVPCGLCGKIMPKWCEQNNNFPLKCGKELKCPTWKQLLTKWMEEQDAAD